MMNIVNVSYASANYYVLGQGRSRLLVDVGWPGTLPKLAGHSGLERQDGLPGARAGGAVGPELTTDLGTDYTKKSCAPSVVPRLPRRGTTTGRPEMTLVAL
jgi:hypothetical protein